MKLITKSRETKKKVGKHFFSLIYQFKKEKTTYWFGKKEENPKHFLSLQVPESYFSTPPPKSPPQLEFPIYNFK